MNGAQHKVVGIGFGLAAAYTVVVGKNDPTGALIAATSVIGCMLPDIDHDKTKIGRKRKFVTELTTKMLNTVIVGGIILGSVAAFLIFKGFVDFGVNLTELAIAVGGLIVIAILKKIVGDSKVFKWATKHRGLMHTLAVPIALFLAMRSSDYPVYHYGIAGLLIGYISHLFADMLTVEGCPVLFPLTRKNIRFPTHFKTKDKVCTRAAYVVAVLVCGVAYVITNIIK